MQAESNLLKNFDGVLPDLDDRFLNGRINNKQDRPFLERETVVERVVAEMEDTRTSSRNKPRLVALWSPRGTGKTSLIRHLACSKQYAEIRRCGRLLVFDARVMLEFLSVSADRLVSAVIIWHLLQIFTGYSVKVAPEQAVAFQRMNFGNVLEG